LVAALQNRAVIILIIGYVAVIWGSSGLRQWIVVFLTFCAGISGDIGAGWWIAVAGVIINLLGVPGSSATSLAIRFDLRPSASCVFRLGAGDRVVRSRRPAAARDRPAVVIAGRAQELVT
jgi:hypothetical protein